MAEHQVAIANAKRERALEWLPIDHLDMRAGNQAHARQIAQPLRVAGIHPPDLDRSGHRNDSPLRPSSS